MCAVCVLQNRKCCVWGTILNLQWHVVEVSQVLSFSQILSQQGSGMQKDEPGKSLKLRMLEVLVEAGLVVKVMLISRQLGAAS